jgi:hypothetical protein
MEMSKIFKVLLLVLSQVELCCPSETTLLKHLLVDNLYRKTSLPNINNEPLDLGVTLRIDTPVTISEKKTHVLILQVGLFYYWKDTRLAWDTSVYL